MRELMLKPGWPGVFRRTVAAGKKTKVLEFRSGQPVEVTEADIRALESDIGIVLFDVIRDEKNRPRFVESVRPADNMELMPTADATDV
jgi:hypothetical protein